MALTVTPIGNGRTKITVDFCYYTNRGLARHYQIYTKHEAEVAAHRYIHNRTNIIGAEVKHDEDKQRFVVQFVRDWLE